MPLAGPTGARHRTKQEFVYRTLREAIMRCDLRPGERLVIDDLARQLEVSIIPVREALQLLQSEMLVVNVPYVGATVAPLSRESIIDVFSVLEGLETVATRLAAERARHDDLDDLGRIVARMDQAIASSQSGEWADVNTQFHLAISALPGLDMLRDMTARTLDRWDRVRRFYFNGVLVHRIVQAQEEHRAILEAMLARDVARLQDLVRIHNQGALAAYLAYLGVGASVAAG
jgi:DNA-binding GntR family transcriptional regulator